MRPSLAPTVRRLPLLCLAAVLALPGVLAAQKRQLGWSDLMQIRSIESPVISDDGGWIAYALEPDRGDGSAVVRSATGTTEYRVELGGSPTISADSRWVAMPLAVPFAEAQAAKKTGKKGDEAPQPGLALLATADGSVTRFDRVASHAFSDDGRWIAIHRAPEKKAEETDDEKPSETESEVEGAVPGAETPPTTETGETSEPPEPEPAEEVEGEETPALELPEPPVEPAPEPGLPTETPPAEPEEAPAEPAEKDGQERTGSTLVLRELTTGAEMEISHVEGYLFERGSRFLVYSLAAPGGEANGLFARDLAAPETEIVLHRTERGRYTALATPPPAEVPTPPLVGFVAAVDDEEGEPGDGTVFLWNGAERAAGEAVEAVAAADLPAGWFVPSVNELTWSRDGERLFLGLKHESERLPDEEEGDEPAGATGTDETAEEPPTDPYDLEAILDEREVDVWHWNDPLIIPNQKAAWEEEKTRTYLAVYHREDDRLVPLADREIRQVEATDNPRAVVGIADVPYLKERTWDGFYFDVYRVSLEDGSRQLVGRRLSVQVGLSPDGRWTAYYEAPHWFLLDAETGSTRNLTEGLPVPFSDEDHDYPADPPSYGLGGWVVDGPGERAETRSLLVYDKFDLWQIPVDPAAGSPTALTDGRAGKDIYRVLDTSSEAEESFVFSPGERLLLSQYNDRDKSWGFARTTVGRPGAETLLHDDAKFTVVDVADSVPRLLYTRESYTEFPDLWTADSALAGRTRLTDANPQLEEIAWGEAELVEWTSTDGAPLQGVLIKPGDYEEGERYPVLVYYYRFFSQRLHDFNEPAVNHRPSFPVYASDGYAIFLPDIRFEVGRPGPAAVASLVPGVEKLVDMGVADPDAIGLHGHSWSGYQTAFVVTQTDAFAAAVAGAPVSNMTSAYGGIRYGSGLARMFQYEKSQSRIGASLWEDRDAYIENSPLFYADRIDTPLLIQFGDQDEAVPWTQGIELYLALRRLGKEAVFLQYRDEPHHLQKYGNKLDYSIKMKEFFDHYLKGSPAPAWMTEGVPYRGE